MSKLRKPNWLRISLNNSAKLNNINELLNSYNLNTVCKEANCPNRIECYGKKTATFMILGSTCSRNCAFCNVTHGTLEAINPDEPKKVADAIIKLGLKHAVITSVTRDDLPDGGATQFAQVIEAIKSQDKDITIEVLIPDFQGDIDALKKVINAEPHIINHNIETIERLYENIRPGALYIRSLELLKNVKDIDPTIMTKSGLMVGLGETYDEVTKVLSDLREYGCDFITIGQYLQPSEKHYDVKEYVHPDTFEKYKEAAYNLGFKFVASAPLVRSSYHAADFYEAFKNQK